MDGVSQDLISILNYLTPGLLATWIFYGLTPYPKPSQLERIVEALIFTLGAQALAVAFGYLYGPVGSWFQSERFIGSVLGAVMIGALASWLANSDKGHVLLRRGQITPETSYPSEWFGVFSKNRGNIILHFKDDSRLYGFPLEWPSDPSKGHFVLAYPAWQGDAGEVRLKDVEKILVPVDEVRWVEFIYYTPPE